MTRPDPAPHIAAVLAAQREKDQPASLFRALDAALAASIGHRLFTVLAHHPAERESERFYTNRPAEYPLGGRKPVTDAPWMRQVLARGEPYIGRTRADIESVFFDHALILSLGCESVLNMPVRWQGRTLGTLNLLHRAGYYEDSDIPLARLFAALALPGLMMITEE
ncbi:MAG TPA: GAF domain-containing protein [Acetobacteraceae bacterium]|nr:GAF domain-containing protein [Acetobacteraceae bacterium]